MNLVNSIENFASVRWVTDQLVLLDQRYLPNKEIYLKLITLDQIIDAISSMVVRGAPAIGITAAYGCVFAARERRNSDGSYDRDGLYQDMQRLSQARPTAVNLSWAVSRMRSVAESNRDIELDSKLMECASDIHRADINANLRIGEYGAGLIQQPSTVLTHCNAGALATGGYGTALGVIRTAHREGKIKRVYADETRPWLQGARLTAWEMVKENIPVSLIPDSAAAHLMRSGEIQWIIVGADRITANGDVVNKIGTYSLAVNARHHGIKFMVAAPCSTIDPDLDSGEQVPIELRDSDEVLKFADHKVAAEGAQAWNPVFDVTPVSLVNAIVTERGVSKNPEQNGVLHLLND